MTLQVDGSTETLVALVGESRKRATHISSMALIIVVILFQVIVWITDSAELISESSIYVLFGTGAATQICLRLNRGNIAAWILLLLTMVSMFFINTFGGVESDYTLAGYIIATTFATMLLPGRRWIIILAISISAELISYYMNYRADTEPFVVKYMLQAALSISYLMMAGTITGLLYNRMSKIIASVQKANQELEIANSALHKSHDHSRMLMETAADPFFLVDENFNIVDCNERALELFGFTRDEFLRMKINDLDPVITEERLKELFDVMDNHNSFVTGHAEPRCKDGTSFLAELLGRSIAFENSRQYYIVVRDITNQVTRERQLQEQKERLQLINDNVPVRIAYCDVDLNVKYFNAKASSTHLDPSKTPNTLNDFIGEDGVKEVLPYFEQAINGNSVHYERVTDSSDGPIVSFVQLNPHIVDGQVAGVFATGIDITALKEAEMALEEKTALLEMIASNLPARIAYFDKDAQLQYANKEFASTYLPDTYELPLNGPSLITHEAWQKRELQLETVFETKQNVTFEIAETLRDGTTIILQKTYVPHIVKDEVVGRVSLGVDITELRQTQETLQRSNDIFNHVINNIPARISYIDKKGYIIFVNDRVEKDFGLSAEKATGQKIEEVLPSAYLEANAPYVYKAFESCREVIFEAPFRIANGDTIIERSHYYPHVVNGRTEALFTLHMDITDLRKTEDSLAKAQKLESLGVLAGGIAHDFNNLLVAMLGQNSLALVKIEEDHPARRHIVQAIAASERAATLTQQMLAYSGRGSFSIGELNLNELIENNLRLFAVSIPKNIQLVTDLSESLPTIEADVAQMQQLVMNLIINAGQAIGDEQGRITISTSQQTITQNRGEFWDITGDPLLPGQYVLIEIQDDGNGMDQETMNRIFDPFFTTKERGTGLGLAAALGIIRGHKGGIHLYSEVGRGTVFQLFFPAGEPTELDTEQMKIAPLETPLLKYKKILIVDDEPSVVEVLSDMLALNDMPTLQATSGANGVALYREHQDDIALVLLDLMMPGMNGEETFRALREINPDVRVILSSGYSEAEATRQFIGRGLADFVQKPYDFDTLITKVINSLNT